MRLVDLRKGRGLSQARLAKEIGVSPSTIAHYELGERAPHLKIARRIAAYFDTPLDDLEFASRRNVAKASQIPETESASSHD